MKITSAEFLKSAAKPEDWPPDDMPEVAFVGRSNVGKSSAINALVQRKGLAITSSTPGRTRLLNFFEVNGRLRLVDLPGYGFAKASKGEREDWRETVEHYLTGRQSLVLIVHLMDLRHDASPLDIELSMWLRELDRPEILVFTKADKLARNPRLTRQRMMEKSLGLKPSDAVLFSGATADGREALWSRILDFV